MPTATAAKAVHRMQQALKWLLPDVFSCLPAVPLLPFTAAPSAVRFLPLDPPEDEGAVAPLVPPLLLLLLLLP